MCKLGVVLACLACTGHGRRLQLSNELSQMKPTMDELSQMKPTTGSYASRMPGDYHRSNPLDNLAAFLLAFNGANAFSPSSLNIEFPLPSRSVTGPRARARAMTPAMQATSRSSLRKALTGAQPIVLDVSLDDPDSAWSLDVQDFSMRMRKAGVTALVMPKSLLEMTVAEQARAKGGFPGPLPVLSEVQLESGDQSELVLSVASLGAAGIMVRCASDGDVNALKDVIKAASAAGLESFIVAGGEAVRTAASTAGATAVACAFDDAVPAGCGDTKESSDESATVSLGVWSGEDTELEMLRECGFNAMLLLDACGGDLKAGIPWCENRVRKYRSKASKLFSSAMFGSTSDDIPPPSERNPRLWAQSQRQAREIMHESARSRGLPPPDLKRKAILPGS